MHFIAFGWLGMMAGIGGLARRYYAQEVVPNALIGRGSMFWPPLLGGARLGGAEVPCSGCVLWRVPRFRNTEWAQPAWHLPMFKMIVGGSSSLPFRFRAPFGQLLAGMGAESAVVTESLPPIDRRAPCEPSTRSYRLGAENAGLGLALVAVVAVFSFTFATIFTLATFDSVHFSCPSSAPDARHADPISSRAAEPRVTFTATSAGLTVAWVQSNGGPDASVPASCWLLLAIGVGTASGLVMGPVIALHGRSPDPSYLDPDDLLTRARRVSHARRVIFPDSRIHSAARSRQLSGHPNPLLILLLAIAVWH
jgi:hypothetical protein